MQVGAFLSAVVPPGGTVVAKAVMDGGRKRFHHRYCKTQDEAVRTIDEWSAGQADIYFALASYKQGFHASPEHPEKRVVRVRTNVDQLKALWLDMDFKAGYPDAAGAIVALRSFCAASGLVAPALLISSGNGLHVYWPLAEAIPLDRWQALSESLKRAAAAAGLLFDPTCTADACRVLRPPGTTNWKDPANPKPVKVLYSNGKTFPVESLEAALNSHRPTKRLANAVASDEFTGGLHKAEFDPARFDEIVKHCAVLKDVAQTHGKDCTEPEWVATLQLLKHCEDRDFWVHPVSDGHPGYVPERTDEKWQHRLANTAGPTLCSTFQSYHPKLCAACPHNGFIKTPVQLGTPSQNVGIAVAELPAGWRISPDGNGIDRLMVDPTSNAKEWVRALRHAITGLRATRSIVTGKYELQFQVQHQKSKEWSITLPSGNLGNNRKLNEFMAETGIVFRAKESQSFIELMATWLSKLQSARRIADVTEQLGWLEEDGKIVGFSCGQTTFYSDGRVRDDVRAAREFTAISKYYEPKGGLEAWKKVARFLTDQNLPAFTAIIAAAFGSPLLRFTGLAGGILSIVSTASGVGKSSTLRCSQAVWGSPVHGMNAVDDTPKSVARKIGYLNNLPAYWDELRGKKTVEDFLTLAFQITQGKEKTRLDSSAQLREMQTWETMLIVAANESIFDAMAHGVAGSDAGVVRTYEITVDPFTSESNRAEITLLFEKLNANYGHAGRVYAQHIAVNHAAIEARVQTVFTNLSNAKHMQASERFWFAIMTVIIVGAETAKQLGLADIDQKTLVKFLLENVDRLRTRSGEVVHMNDSSEVLAAYMQAHQDGVLIVDRFPAPRATAKGYLPDITGGIPRSDRVFCHISREDKLLRLSQADFVRWMTNRNLPAYTILKRLKDEDSAIEIKCSLGIGTKWQLPRQRCLQIPLDRLGPHEELIGSVAATEAGS